MKLESNAEDRTKSEGTRLQRRLRKNARKRDRYASDPEFRAASLLVTTSWQKAHPKQYAYQKKATAANAAAKKHGIAGRLNVSDIHRLIKSNPMRCIYCGRRLSSLPGKREIWQIEHKIPLSRGGANEYLNLAIADTKCNSSKRNRTPEEFKAYKAKHATPENNPDDTECL